jgi:hypothetical protein
MNRARFGNGNPFRVLTVLPRRLTRCRAASGDMALRWRIPVALLVVIGPNLERIASIVNGMSHCAIYNTTLTCEYANLILMYLFCNQ